MPNTISRFTRQGFGRYVDAVVTVNTKGATALDQTTSVGIGAIITRTGTGEYLMTTTTPAKSFIGGHAAIRLASPNGSVAVPGAVTHNSDGTFSMVIKTYDNTAVPALFDAAAATGNCLTGYMTLKVVGP